LLIIHLLLFNMKLILGYFKDFWNEQNPLHLLFVGVFLTASIYFNYLYDIENGVIDAHYHTIQHFYYYFLLYSVSFVPIYLSYAFDKVGRAMLSQSGLWLRMFFALAVFSFYCYFYQYRHWIDLWISDAELQQVIKICANQIVPATIMFLVVVIFWWILDRKNQAMYGFKLKGSHFKIYFVLLMAMVPLIVAASFTSDFQTYYPTARRMLNYDVEGIPTSWVVALYELCYGLEFFHIEFFFRGFLIFGFVKYAGSRAILPAAVFYCFIHFGKPAVECISSFFGGIALGVLSYRSQSIVAGVIIHLGIAWLMELVAGIWLWKTLFP